MLCKRLGIQTNAAFSIDARQWGVAFGRLHNVRIFSGILLRFTSPTPHRCMHHGLCVCPACRWQALCEMICRDLKATGPTVLGRHTSEIKTSRNIDPSRILGNGVFLVYTSEFSVIWERVLADIYCSPGCVYWKDQTEYSACMISSANYHYRTNLSLRSHTRSGRVLITSNYERQDCDFLIEQDWTLVLLLLFQRNFFKCLN